MGELYLLSFILFLIAGVLSHDRSVTNPPIDWSDRCFYGEGGCFITTFSSENQFKISGIDTSNFNNGDDLYISPNVPGELTNIEPI